MNATIAVDSPGVEAKACGAALDVAVGADERDWTILLPFHNERAHLPDTIASLAAQTEPFVLLLIDNGSSDGGGAVAAAVCERLGVEHRLIVERRPGKVAALHSGSRQARTRFIATCDADTYYPPDYLARARRLLENGGVMVGARFRPRAAKPWVRWVAALHLFIAALILPGQCLSGGAGQAFRADGLEAAGGFDQSQWDFVLEDHEICHRLASQGEILYDPDFWCDPAQRDRKRPTTRWTLGERLIYHLVAGTAGNWFFYDFLAARLAKRGLSSARLRVDPDAPS